MKILSVFLILLIFAIPDVWAQVNIENDQYYVGNDDTIHIVGEILNDSNKPLNQVNILATLYSGNSIIHQTNSETLTNVIMPGMKGVFDIIITENIDGIDKYVLDLDYKIANPKSQVIEITSSEKLFFFKPILLTPEYFKGSPIAFIYGGTSWTILYPPPMKAYSPILQN